MHKFFIRSFVSSLVLLFTFTNLIKLAGLRSPFVDGCLEDVVGNIKNWLDNIDLKKL